MKTELRKTTDPMFDADTIIATLPNGAEFRVYAFDGYDGTPVVQIDTDPDPEVGRFRINVNDGAIWDQDAEAPTPLDRIHHLLDGAVWSPETLDAIAEVIMSTGRTISEPS